MPRPKPGSPEWLAWCRSEVARFREEAGWQPNDNPLASELVRAADLVEELISFIERPLGATDTGVDDDRLNTRNRRVIIFAEDE